MYLIKSILFFLLCSLSVFANTTPLATKITDLAWKSVTYDNNGKLIKTIDGVTTNYLIDTNTAYAQVISESKNGTDVHYTYGNDLISNGSSFYLTDALGSARGLVDTSETLTDSYDYTPYGELTNHTGTSENNFLFTGEQLDQETEDYYLRARYYSPNSTRFISRDTYDGVAGNPITQNHYLYGNANPAMYVDPSGRMSMMSLTNSLSIMGTLASMRTIGSSAIVRGAITTTARTLARDIAKGAKGGIGKTISTTQMYYILTIARLYSRLGDDTSNDMIPIQVYGSNNLPEHQDHIFDSMVGMGSNGRPTPAVLHRSAGHSRSWLDKVLPTRKKYARDEYPYAKTAEGGEENHKKHGVSVRYVSRVESGRQGAFIGTFYSNTVNIGDDFLVIPLGGISGYFDKRGRWTSFPK